MSSTPTGPQDKFFEFLSAGKFMLQRDPSTNEAIFPPRLRSPGAGAPLDAWEPVSGRGKIYSLTVQYARPPAPPRIVVLIDLEEGGRMLSTIEDVAPEAVAIGASVQARIVPDGDELPRIVFDLTDDGPS